MNSRLHLALAGCGAAAVFLFQPMPRIQAGSVAFDPGLNCIHIAGFPEEAPATLDDILTADRANGWGRAAYDAAADLYTVKASLQIGTNADWGTFFQIGRTNHPRETLMLHGHLTVAPPRNMGRIVHHYQDYAGGRYDGRLRVSNRLTLGIEGNPAVRPTVKVACAAPGGFSIRLLADAPPKTEKGHWYYVPMGELFMFHAALTAADTNCPFAAALLLSHTGLNFKMRNSRIAWWRGNLFGVSFVATRGLNDDDRTVTGMTFENGGSAAAPFDAVDCIFSNLEVATQNRGATRCVFEGNRVNFQMLPSQAGIILTDCVIGPPEQPLRLPRSTRDEKWLRHYSVYKQSSDLNLVKNPGIIERISLPVQVSDGRGRPVVGAAVLVDCQGDVDDLFVQRSLAVTGPDGMTPDDALGRALLITRREYRPTDDPAKPETIAHVYNLTVMAPGHAVYRMTFDSAAEIPRPLIVALPD